MSAEFEFGNDAESDEETFNPQPGYGSDDDAPAKPARAKSPLKRRRSNDEAAEQSKDEPDGAADEDAEGEGEDLGGDDEDDKDADEDEDDEDDEEDEEDEEVARPKKRRKERRNQFIDVEAEVDDEDEDIDDDEDDQVQAEFVADTHPDDEGLGEADRDDRRHRELDRQRQAEMEIDAEEQAKRFKERYGRNRAAAAGTTVIPQRLLLPSVEDPSIYGVRCKPGKEKEVIMALFKRWEEKAGSRDPLRIASAFERGSTTMQGYIYVEARNQTDALHAVDGITNCYPRTNMLLIPITERPDLLRVQKTKSLEPGQYVRWKKRDVYHGDLAQVYEVDPNGVDVSVKMVPRLDYGATEDAKAPHLNAEEAAKRKRAMAFGRGAMVNRPPRRLFNESEAKKRHARYLSQGTSYAGGKEFSYFGSLYVDGLLIANTRISALDPDVQPTLEEVSLFSSSNEDGDGVDLAALAQSMKSANVTDNYILGDVVEIFSGEQKGVVGKVSTTRANIVSVRVTEGELAGQMIEAPVKTLRKRFREGDHVRVVGASKYLDEMGFITRIKDDRVTLLSDATHAEITVFSRDLRAANEAIINTANSKYDLHDLVQLDAATVAMVIRVDRESLRVLDQNGNVRTILPSEVTEKHERRKMTVATDRDGAEIRHDDTVREAAGEQRTGQIKQIHRQYIFIQNRQQTENAGIFVARTSNVITIAAKGGRTQTGPDLSKMNPALMQQRAGGPNGAMAPPTRPSMGRDRLIGKTVKIRKGDNKGAIGLVKDTTATAARVEMAGRNKIVEYPKDILTVIDEKTGQPLDSSRFGVGPGAAGGNRGGTGSTSYGSSSRIPGGSRTPAAAWSSSKTPAWASSSGSASSWGKAPPPGGYGGGRTPVAASGGMTAYGGRTAYGGATSYGGSTSYGGYNSGSATNYGGSTAYGGQAGNSTAYGGYGSSGYGNAAPTPGGSGDQPTPGFGATPAASAPTPGGYGAPTPGFEDDGYE